MVNPLRLVTLAALALAGVGCTDDDHAHYIEDGYDDGNYACAPGVDASAIDSGSTLDIDPGVGAGMTAEYLGDGAWRFATACDTSLSGYSCHWDVIVTALDGDIQNVAPESLERGDTLDTSLDDDQHEDAVHFVATNDFDLDAFTLDATPGATLEIDVLLDDQCGGTYLHWLKDAHVVQSDTQATDLTPSAP